MSEDLINRIKIFNEIKYGNNDNETKIIFTTLKPEGTVTTAPKDKEKQANVTRKKFKIFKQQTHRIP